MTGAELWRIGASVDLALKPAKHDLLNTLLLGGFELVRLAEANWVENFEQAGKTPGVPVVRSRAQEQTVLELRREQTKHLSEVAVVSKS